MSAQMTGRPSWVKRVDDTWDRYCPNDSTAIAIEYIGAEWAGSGPGWEAEVHTSSMLRRDGSLVEGPGVRVSVTDPAWLSPRDARAMAAALIEAAEDVEAADPSTGGLGEVIRAHLKDRDVRHHEMAITIGLTPGEFSQRITGKSPFLVAELVAIARELSVSVSDLLEEAGL